MFLLIAAIILCCAAFADGYTTWSGVKTNKLVCAATESLKQKN